MLTTQLWSNTIRLGVEYKKAALNTLAETAKSATAVATPSTPSKASSSAKDAPADAEGSAVSPAQDVEMIPMDNQIDPILFK